MMSAEEIDAHLYVLGITSDARGVDVMILGNPVGSDGDRTRNLSLSGLIAERVRTFGARVWWDHDSITKPELRVDYLIAIPRDNDTYSIPKLADTVLRPGGRYMVLIDDVADTRADVELIDVRQIGDGQIRAIGWKRRPLGGD